jgi:sugar O-acyltransferase (sialic acid O-acetyltransferase NeuD family)
MNSKIIIGAGRHAAETFYLVQDIGFDHEIVGFAVDEATPGTKFLNKPVLVIDEVIQQYKGRADKPEVLVAIGTVAVNKRLVQKFSAAGFSFFNAIHPDTRLERQGAIGRGVTITAGCTLTCNVTLGDHVIVNIGCTISHDCIIGNHVNISPGCHLAGNVVIEDDVFVGVGASFIPKVKVGKGSIVAAGACVTKDVAPYTMVAGVPAMVKKQLTA